MVFYLNAVNLDSVVANTNGSPINISRYNNLSVYVEVSGNTGAVTVNIEASATGRFAGEEAVISTTTYVATNQVDIRDFNLQGGYIRTTTTSQANSTVKTTLKGKE